MKWNDYFSYETGDESVCVTMEGSERSYELLGRYGEGQKLYDMEKQVDATKQHFLALDCHDIIGHFHSQIFKR